MKRSKINLTQLSIASFVTATPTQQIRGGNTLGNYSSACATYTCITDNLTCAPTDTTTSSGGSVDTDPNGLSQL